MGFYASAFGQSTDQANPTPITSNEINGEIRARDIGDSRLTTFYYLFRGERGDVFINVVTSNINGAIDVFTRSGLRPRTKITLYADNPENETGRVVYMRESELLLIRIQGRTPNDDPGRYQLKFAGSFAPLLASAEDETPRVEGRRDGEVRVNSVGTIIETPPEETRASEKAEAEIPAADRDTEEKRDVVVEKPGEEVAAGDPKKAADAPVTDAVPAEGTERKTPKKDERKISENVPGVTVTDPYADAKRDEDPQPPAREVTVELKKGKPKRSALVTISRVPREPEATEAKTEVLGEEKPEATDKSKPEVRRETAKPKQPTLAEKLAKIQLRVLFKDGTVLEKPMNEVLSVNVIKGVLTIVTSDGKILEYSILDVETMSIK